MPSATVASVAAHLPDAPPQLQDTGLAFHRVATFDYPIAFAALGGSALLVAGERNPVPLLIADSALQFVPELAKLNSATHFSYVLRAGGSWPDNAWIALSHSSDAGPSDADVYQWNPDPQRLSPGGMRGLGWVKKHEHDKGVLELVVWRERPVLLGTHFGVPVRQNHALGVLSSTGLRELGESGCTDASEPLAPIWLHNGSLSVFGYACEGSSPANDSEALLMDTWSAAGVKTRQRFALPADRPVDRIVLDHDGPALLFLSDHPPRLARFAGGNWVSIATLPGKAPQVLPAADHALWLTSDEQLLRFRGSDWTRTPLPRDPESHDIHWVSIWERSPNDLWLIGRAQNTGHSLLFNSASGKLGTAALPSASELEALGLAMTREPEHCPHPFANFVAQAPHQLGGDEPSPKLSDDEARARLRKALLAHPRLQHLKFVRHDCYGLHCIGAVVDSVREAETLAALLPADAYGTGLDLRCVPPPETEPFPVLP